MKHTRVHKQHVDAGSRLTLCKPSLFHAADFYQRTDVWFLFNSEKDPAAFAEGECFDTLCWSVDTRVDTRGCMCGRGFPVREHTSFLQRQDYLMLDHR